MTKNEILNQKVWEKMQAELDSFIAKLKTKPPPKIIESAYALTYKEDILQSFDFELGGNCPLSNEQASRSKGNAPKKANNAIKTGNPQSVKATERTAKTTAKAGQKAAQVKSISATKNAERTRKAAQHIKASAQKAGKVAKDFAKALTKVVKVTIAAAKSLV